MSTMPPNQLPSPTHPLGGVPSAPVGGSTSWDPTAPWDSATPWATTSATPVAPQTSWTTAPAGWSAGGAPAPVPTPPKRRNSVIAGVVAGLLAIGGIGAAINHGSGGSAAPTTTVHHTTHTVDTTDDTTDVTVDPTVDTVAQNAAGLTDDEITEAYTQILGVTPSSTTIACVDGELDGDDAGLPDVIAGSTLTAAQYSTAFTPLLTCAPDADFVAAISPIVTQVIGADADTDCIASGLASIDLEHRVGTLIEFAIQQSALITEIQQGFASCAA